MALTKKDITLLKEIFVTKDEFYSFQKEFKSFKVGIFQEMKDQSRFTVDLMRQETLGLFANMKRELISELAAFFGDRIVPQIDNHEERITRLEHIVA